MLNNPEEQANYSQTLDRMFHSYLSQLTLGLSPAALMLAYVDWYIHLYIHPAKQIELNEYAQGNLYRFWCYFLDYYSNQKRCELCIKPNLLDKRFKDESWQQYPFQKFYLPILFTSTRMVGTCHYPYSRY